MSQAMAKTIQKNSRRGCRSVYLRQNLFDTVIDTAVPTEADRIGDNLTVEIEKDDGRNRADIILIHDRLRARIVNIDGHKSNFALIISFGPGNDSIKLLAWLAPGSRKVNYSWSGL